MAIPQQYYSIHIMYSYPGYYTLSISMIFPESFVKKNRLQKFFFLGLSIEIFTDYLLVMSIFIKWCPQQQEVYLGKAENTI